MSTATARPRGHTGQANHAGYPKPTRNRKTYSTPEDAAKSAEWSNAKSEAGERFLFFPAQRDDGKWWVVYQPRTTSDPRPVSGPLTVRVDGACLNPGPSACACVVFKPDGQVDAVHARYVGTGTNNSAEYAAVLLALEVAENAGATSIDIATDSKLIVDQVNGDNAVNNAGLKPLHASVVQRLGALQSWSIRWVPREQNALADAAASGALSAVLALPDHERDEGSTIPGAEIPGELW